MKECRVCSLSPEETEFPKHPGFKDGLDSICKSCKAEKQRAKVAERNPEDIQRRRDNWRKSKYGVNGEEYRKMLEDQNGICKICGGTNGDLQLAVDHCHNSLKVRGLLCNMCNRGLGLFRDNSAALRAAAEYLEGC